MGLLVAAAAACSMNSTGSGAGTASGLPTVVKDGSEISLERMISELAGARAVLIGESHDRFDHHRNQLEIIKRLYAGNPGLAIGMEQFQQPFQPWLDRYVQGRISTARMLIETQYYDRWRFDYRLYEPILSFARANGIPVIALNLPRELTRKAAAGGLESLSDEQAARLPEIDRSDAGYRERLRRVFQKHPTTGSDGSFERFYTAQLLWDEGMAARAAEHLRDNPEATLVILAGSGHVAFGSGIPDRLARRIDGRVATVVHAGPDDGKPGRAPGDYVLKSGPVTLPEPGLLGVTVADSEHGLRVEGLTDDSAAGAAGVEPGDVITAVGGQAVDGFAELKARMWDKRPGDGVALTVRRSSGDTFSRQIELR